MTYQPVVFVRRKQQLVARAFGPVELQVKLAFLEQE